MLPILYYFKPIYLFYKKCFPILNTILNRNVFNSNYLNPKNDKMSLLLKNYLHFMILKIFYIILSFNSLHIYFE